MALLTLTPTSGSPASIEIDENDIFRVTDYGTGALVVYSGPSAFLGDQQSVIVNESVSDINAMSIALIPVTVGSATNLINSGNIFDVVSDGMGGSKIMYKEFGNITYLFVAEAPADIKTLAFSSGNNKKYSVGSLVTTDLTPAFVAEVVSGYFKVDTTGAAINITLPDFADFVAAGYGEGSVITFFVENATLGSGNNVTVIAGANTSQSALNGYSLFMTDNTQLCLGKFELVIQASQATLTRVY